MEQVWFKQGEAAQYLRFSLAFFRRHVHPHIAIYVKQEPRYSRADLDEFMSRKKAEATRPPPRRKKSVLAALSAKGAKGAKVLQELTKKRTRAA